MQNHHVVLKNITHYTKLSHIITNISIRRGIQKGGAGSETDGLGLHVECDETPTTQTHDINAIGLYTVATCSI